MPYLLNMHGKWINRSGKMLFSYPEDVEAQIGKITKDSMVVLAPILGYKKAKEKILLSYTVFWIDDDSLLMDQFQPSTVISIEIFTPGTKERKPSGQPIQQSANAASEAQKSSGSVEVKDKGGATNPERLTQRKYCTLRRTKDINIPKHEQEQRESPGFQYIGC